MRKTLLLLLLTATVRAEARFPRHMMQLLLEPLGPVEWVPRLGAIAASAAPVAAISLSREEQKERWIEAQVALGQEDYARALALLRQLAALGDAEAMFKGGRWRCRGLCQCQEVV